MLKSETLCKKYTFFYNQSCKIDICNTSEFLLFFIFNRWERALLNNLLKRNIILWVYNYENESRLKFEKSKKEATYERFLSSMKQTKTKYVSVGLS